MDAYIREWLKKDRHTEYILLAAVTLLAVLVRVSVRSFVSDDWIIFWDDWLLQLKNKGFSGLSEDFYDYAPPIMYFLYLITRLPMNYMTAYKGVCCLLDFAGAAMVGALVLECTKNRKRAVFAYSVFLFLPTVILNAAVWCQCDMIYTLLILISMYFLLKDRPWMGMWFYGAAFSVKLQTLFIFPFLVILWVRKKVDLKHFVTIPVMYFLGILPAWLAGRPFSELLDIYIAQGGQDRWSLSIKFPNIYQIIGNDYFLDEYMGAGMYLILGILMIVMFWLAYRKVRVTREYVILLALFFGILTTYFLPHMHERYLYLTDAFLLIYGMIRLRRFPLFVTAAFTGIVGYSQYLTKQAPPVPYGVLAILQLGILIVLGLDLYRFPVCEDERQKPDDGEKNGKVDQLLRDLLFRTFTIGSLRFEFLEGLLAVCITGAGFLLRTPFETGLPYWTYLLAEWYLAVASAVFVRRATKSRRRALGTYAIVVILPCLVAEGTILRGDACLGALLFVCALLFLEPASGNRCSWLFTIVTGGLLLWSVRYAGLLFACVVLWQKKRLDIRQLLLLLAAGGARFAYTYRVWLHAGYTLATFHWPNIYEIVGRETVQGQLVDPVALVGLFVALGLPVILLWLFSQGDTDRMEAVTVLRLFLFFGLTAGFLLPYMDQSYGCLYGVLGALYVMLAPREFPVGIALQFVVYAGYQEGFRESSMMPMALFAALQFVVICRLGIRALEDVTGVRILCRQKS